MKVGSMYRHKESKAVVIVVKRVAINTSANTEKILQYVNLGEVDSGQLTVMSTPSEDLFQRSYTLMHEGP